jgi:hypothetical protein
MLGPRPAGTDDSVYHVSQSSMPGCVIHAISYNFDELYRSRQVQFRQFYVLSRWAAAIRKRITAYFSTADHRRTQAK